MSDFFFIQKMFLLNKQNSAKNYYYERLVRAALRLAAPGWGTPEKGKFQIFFLKKNEGKNKRSRPLFFLSGCVGGKGGEGG